MREFTYELLLENELLVLEITYIKTINCRFFFCLKNTVINSTDQQPSAIARELTTEVNSFG